MTAHDTRWVCPPERPEDPERIATRAILAFGKAVNDEHRAFSFSIANLAVCADMTADEIECIEEGGTAYTIDLLRCLAAALDADVRLTPGHNLRSVRFEMVRTTRGLTFQARLVSAGSSCQIRARVSEAWEIGGTGLLVHDGTSFGQTRLVTHRYRDSPDGRTADSRCNQGRPWSP
jgi:hypothetical protein